jgi:hypothetical protein
MPYSRSVDQLGVKLTPKLIHAISQSVIATKRGLLDTEHKLRVGAMQTVIDRAGHEVGEHIRPLVAAGIDLNPNMSPAVREYLERAASGDDQWQAVAGNLTMSSASGTLSQIIGNELAPLVYNLTRLNPNLLVPADVVAAAYARNIDTQASAYEQAAKLGFDSDQFSILTELATTVPDMATLFDLYNRGYLELQDMRNWLSRAGLPPALLDNIGNLHNILLSPADAALGVLRSDITQQQGYAVANANGMTNANFDVLLLNTGEPPGLMQLLEAFRRGFIDENTLHRGVLQSRIRDEWWPTIYALRYEPLSTADAIQASIQGYITKDQAKEYATQNGLNPDDFDAAWSAAGEPLSRTEMTYLVNWGFASMDDYKSALQQSRLKDEYIPLAENLLQRPMSVADAVESYVQGYMSQRDSDTIMGMNGLRAVDRPILQEMAGEPISKTEALSLLRRGLMTVEQVEQALRESRLKDKYIPDVLELQTVYPGIYDIRLLVSEGAIDDATAAQLLAIEGYPATLIKPLIAAFSGSTSTASKAVTESMLVDLYLESAIDATELTEMLEALGYSSANAALILEVTEWKAELTARTSLISSTRTQYVAGKITAQQAENALTVALVPPAAITKVMADWQLEVAAKVKQLSETQVVDAWNASLFSPGDPPANTSKAVAYLGVLGYSAADADILLQLKNKPLFDGSPSGNSTKSKANTQGTSGTGS